MLANLVETSASWRFPDDGGGQMSEDDLRDVFTEILRLYPPFIGGYRVVDASVYIFVQTHLQRDDLSAIEYLNAEKRAEDTVKLYRDALKIAPEKIKVIRNASKAEILKLFSVLDMKAYN